MRDVEKQFREALLWMNQTGAGLTGEPDEVEQNVRRKYPGMLNVTVSK